MAKKRKRTRTFDRDPCAYCYRLPTRDDPNTRDHVVPKAHGGAGLANNVVPSCRRCNMEKGSKSLLVFLLDRGGLGPRDR